MGINCYDNFFTNSIKYNPVTQGNNCGATTAYWIHQLIVKIKKFYYKAIHNHIITFKLETEARTYHSEDSEFPGVNLSDTLLTQWRSSVGVRKPSPLKTWPRCPPQAAHVISILRPSGSACTRCPYMRYAGYHSKIAQEEPRRKRTYSSVYGPRESLVEGRPTAVGVEFGCRLVEGSSTSCTFVHALRKELVIFTSTRKPGRTEWLSMSDRRVNKRQCIIDTHLLLCNV